MNKSVTAIVVTYNRKQELNRCINALITQTRVPDDILIVDNASTDGTLLMLKKSFDLNQLSKKDTLEMVGNHKNIKFWIYGNSINGGGSAGFYYGMKNAFEKIGTDYYWMMDDDGYPSSNCLEMLMLEAEQYDYIMPTSIDINDHSKLSWPTRDKNGTKTIEYVHLKDSYGKIMNFVTPFNGVLLSKECISKVGYVNKDFFIWGDEYDHYWRCKKQGINPVTLLDAKFYHPSQKLPLVKIMGGTFTAPYVDSKLRMVCLARNYTYIYKNYNQGYKIPLKFLQYTWLFLITRHLDFAGWWLYVKSVWDGLTNNFTRHRKYIGK